MNKILIVLPGFGDPYLLDKIIIWKKNLDIICNQLKNYEIHLRIFNYNNVEIDLSDIKYDNLHIIQELKEGIVGYFIYNFVKPDYMYNYVFLSQDDVEIQNIDLEKCIELTNTFDIVSPVLTLNSRYSHNSMLHNKSHIGSICEVNFIELFFYVMKTSSYEKYHNILDENSRWLWGIDTALHLHNFKLALIHDYQITHYVQNSKPDNYKQIEFYYNEKRLGCIGEQVVIKKTSLH